MVIRTRRSWELPESAATPENVWMNRRAWLKGAGFAGLGLATSGLVLTAAMAAIGGYPYPRNEAYQLDRALTDEEMARLKFTRRMYWHWRGTRTGRDGKDGISDQELADHGIKTAQEPYIEYVKRPPHDKYL